MPGAKPTLENEGFCVVVTVSDITWFVVGLVQLSTFVALLAWMHLQRKRAQQGDSFAARRLLFPAHVHIILVIALAELLESSVEICAPIITHKTVSPMGRNYSGTTTMFAIAWGVYHFAGEGLLFLLLQPGCGRRAFRNALIVSTLWGVSVVWIVLYIFHHPATQKALIVDIFWEGGMAIGYGIVWLTPKSLFERRPGAIFYSRFWCILSTLYAIAGGINLANPRFGSCLFLACEVFGFAILKTYVAYKALVLDAKWWQGLHGTTATHSFSFATPLLPFNQDAAHALAEQMDNFSRARSLLLNSAFLFIDSNSPLGSGSLSKVYKGKWKQRPCAVKMLHSDDITPQHISKCVTETQLLARVSHPNVVRLFGISVVPPSFCLVLELCSHGSLFSLLHESNNQEPSFSWLQKLSLAVDAAQGLAAMHSAGIAHHDVKSLNFLVHEIGGGESSKGSPSSERQLIVKIADLDVSSEEARAERKSSRETDGALNWVAPECLRNNTYDTMRSDIFSLGMVLYEILCQRIPFDRMFSNQIEARLMAGELPALPPTPNAAKDGCVDTYEFVGDYVQLVRQMWSLDSVERPTAHSVVETLVQLRNRVRSKQ